MKTKRSIHGHGGYTLPELMVYGFVLAIIFNMSMSLFLSAKRLDRLGDLAFGRVSGVEAIGRDFVRSVQHAGAVVGDPDDADGGASRVSLRRTTVNGRTILSVWARNDAGFLKVQEFLEDGEARTLRRQREYTLPIEDVYFDYGGSAPERARTVRMTLTIENGGTPNTTPAENVFVASLRGRSVQP